MIKFRYKRKESSSGTANAVPSGATVAATTNANVINKNNENNNDVNVSNLNASNNSIGDHKSNDAKTGVDTKTNSLKRDVTPKARIDENKSGKMSSVSDDEYLADCIRAVVVSETIY